MEIRRPVVWMTILYVTGIVAGLAVPAVPAYLALSAALLVIGSATFRTFRNFSDIVLLGTWFFLGAARVGLHTDSHERDAGWIAAMQEEARTQKDSFVGRLSSGTSNPRSIAISAALLCGDKSLLDADTRESFKRVGAMHLLALSGLHLGVLYGMLHLLLVRWMMGSYWRWALLPLILACIWCYVWFAGMPTSLLRAGIMLSFFVTYMMLGAKPPPYHILCISALLILLVSPEMLLNISFQLSYAATSFIVCFYSAIRKLIYQGRSRIADILAVSIAAQLGTMPLCIYYFHSLSLVAVPASIVLIPLTTVVVYMGVALALFPTSAVASALDTAVDAEMRVMDFMLIPSDGYWDGILAEPWQIMVLYILEISLLLRTKTLEEHGREPVSL